MPADARALADSVPRVSVSCHDEYQTRVSAAATNSVLDTFASGEEISYEPVASCRDGTPSAGVGKPTALNRYAPQAS